MAKIEEELLTDESDGQPEIVAIKRINQQMIKNNTGFEISIVGKYIRTYEGKTSFQASDGGYFMVKYKQNVMIPQYNSVYNEIRGVPDENGVIKYISHQSFGNDLNMEIWNKFVELTQNYPCLF